MGLEYAPNGTASTHSVSGSGLPCHGSRQSGTADLCRWPGSQALPGNVGGSLPKDRMGASTPMCSWVIITTLHHFRPLHAFTLHKPDGPTVKHEASAKNCARCQSANAARFETC